MALLEMTTSGCQAPDTPSQSAALPAGHDVDYWVPVDLAPSGSKPVTFHKVIVSADSQTAFGHISGGLLNMHLATLTVSPGAEPKPFLAIGTEELRRAHYTVPTESHQLFGDDEPTAFRYQLGAEITWLQLDVHLTPGWSVPTVACNGGMSIKWQLYDTQSRTVVWQRSVDSAFHRVTKGNSAEPPLMALFRENVRQFLADAAFAKFMEPGPAAARAPTLPASSSSN